MSFWTNVVGVTFTIEAAFGYAWNATPTWTDITTHVRSVSINRGKSDEFGEFGPGTATITLNNRGRLFDPSYSAGTYFGDLNPMVPVRVMADTGSGDETMYRGFITGWPQRYVPPNEAVAVVPCVDATRFMEQAQLPGSYYESKVLEANPVGYLPMQSLEPDGSLLETVGDTVIANRFGVAPASGNTRVLPSLTTGMGAPLGGDSALIAPTDDGDATIYGTSWRWSAVASAPKAMSMWVRPGTAAATGASVQVYAASTSYIWVMGTTTSGGGLVNIRYSNATDSKYYNTQTLGDGLELDNAAWSHLALRADSTNLYAIVNGQQVKQWTLTAGTLAAVTDDNVVQLLNDGGHDDTSKVRGALAHVAWWSTAPSTATFQSHYEAGTVALGYPNNDSLGLHANQALFDSGLGAQPIAVIDGDGKTRMGPYLPNNRTALDYLRSVASSERGSVYVSRTGAITVRSRNQRFVTLPLSGGAGVNLLTEDSEALLTEDSENLHTEGAGFATFVDNTTGYRYNDVTIDANSVEALCNSVVLTYDGGTVRAEDATSIAAYGPATESIDVSLVTRRRTAEKLAAFVLRTSKDPQTRVTQLTVTVRRDATSLAPLMSTIDLGDSLLIERTPQGIGSAISERVTVQGVNHEITPDQWTTTLYLSPALGTYDVAPYLLAGDVTYGKVGAVAGNLVPA